MVRRELLASEPGSAAADFDEFQRELTRLEQAHIDLTARLDERTGELRVARGAIRELSGGRDRPLTGLRVGAG